LGSSKWNCSFGFVSFRGAFLNAGPGGAFTLADSGCSLGRIETSCMLLLLAIGLSGLRKDFWGAVCFGWEILKPVKFAEGTESAEVSRHSLAPVSAAVIVSNEPSNVVLPIPIVCDRDEIAELPRWCFL